MDGDRRLGCPRCKGGAMLAPVVFEERGVNAEALACRRCGGHFFAPDQLSTISQVPVPDRVSLESIPDALEQLHGIQCPGCSDPGPMLKAQSRRDRRVTLDVCGSCGGIWLDGGELEAVRGHAAGFFDAAREWLKS